MNKKELVFELNKIRIKHSDDRELARILANHVLIDYIDNKNVKIAYDKIDQII